MKDKEIKSMPTYDDQVSKKPLRTVKSFVKRGGRLTVSQKRALETLSDKYLIEFDENHQLNFLAHFKIDQKVVVEVGFGMGSSLVEMAINHPDINYLGIEVHLPGVGNILKEIQYHQLTNLKVINHDAIDVIKCMLKDESIFGFQIFFPDPWHKKRHHKRRLIQNEFINLLVKKLTKGGFIHCATDWQAYSEHMLDVLSGSSCLVNQYDDYAPRPKDRPLTKFERRGNKLSHGVWDLIFNKK